MQPGIFSNEKKECFPTVITINATHASGVTHRAHLLGGGLCEHVHPENVAFPSARSIIELGNANQCQDRARLASARTDILVCLAICPESVVLRF